MNCFPAQARPQRRLQPGRAATTPWLEDSPQKPRSMTRSGIGDSRKGSLLEPVRGEILAEGGRPKAPTPEGAPGYLAGMGTSRRIHTQTSRELGTSRSTRGVPKDAIPSPSPPRVGSDRTGYRSVLGVGLQRSRTRDLQWNRGLAFQCQGQNVWVAFLLKTLVKSQ
jgi:hypothetical protein